MNDRINKLAGQAKFMAEEAINKKISKNAELDAFAEKFAELIVQECMDCALWVGKFNTSSAGPAQVAYAINQRIKKQLRGKE